LKLLNDKNHASARKKDNLKATVDGSMVGGTEKTSKERKDTQTFHQESSEE
jgi:hypothetical protein